MQAPKLVVNQHYRIVFEEESDNSLSAVGGSNQRIVSETAFKYVGMQGDWWGFVGGDSLSRLIVNPEKVSYLWLQVAVGDDPSDFTAHPVGG